MDHSDASGSSTFFLFLYLFFLMKDYGSIVIFPTFIVYFVSLVLSASPFSSKLVFSRGDGCQKYLTTNGNMITETLFHSSKSGLFRLSLGPIRGIRQFP